MLRTSKREEMLRTSPCSSSSASFSSWADGPAIRQSTDWRAGAGEKQQQRMMHSELIPSVGASSSSSTGSKSRGNKSVSAQSLSSRWRLKQGFDSGLGGSIGTKNLRESGRQIAKEETSRIAVSRENGSSGDEDEAGVMQIMERVTTAGHGGERGDGVVEVQVHKMDSNSRKIVAKISIGAPLESVWAILTDYEHLADFIPGLAVSELLEKRHNGARLYQVGEQNLAFGVTFKAKAVVECEEKPTKVHHNFIRRDIDFVTVEGDFQVFRGTWRMEQEVSTPSSASQPAGGGGEITTILSYILVVQPKLWLPVALVEGRLTSEVKTNLVSIRNKSLQP